MAYTFELSFEITSSMTDGGERQNGGVWVLVHTETQESSETSQLT